ncbi:MAG TPA: hypothetical protein VM534_09330, partial [Thermoanaerobaculia bacterium]|nr:hypothetical protein [Thermoanaerobaculia bacterium]
ILAAGIAIRWLIERGRRWKAVLVALAIWYAAGTLHTFPHFLVYFNELAGGPGGGNRYLDDSNIEWGESFYSLRRHLDNHGRERAKLEAFKPLPYSAFGLDLPSMNFRDVVWPEEDVTYYVGGSLLRRSSLSQEIPGVRFEWVGRYRPVDRIGGIFVYRFTTDPARKNDRDVFYVSRELWYGHAIRQAGSILAGSPGYAEGKSVLADLHADRGAWLQTQGDTRGAMISYLAAATGAPTDDPALPLHRVRFANAYLRYAATIPSIAPAASNAPPPEYLDALVHLREGDGGLGIASLVEAVRTRPDFTPAGQLLDQRLRHFGFPRLARATLEVPPDAAPPAGGSS